jgi:hypothetical protein
MTISELGGFQRKEGMKEGREERSCELHLQNLCWFQRLEDLKGMKE